MTQSILQAIGYRTSPRQTKIIATVGPASADEASLRALIETGVDTFRLNFSFGTPDEHERNLSTIRKLENEMSRPIAVMQDLQGAKIRVGKLKDGPFLLEPGQEVSDNRRRRGRRQSYSYQIPSLDQDRPPRTAFGTR